MYRSLGNEFPRPALRSMLFVPGNREDLMDKALNSGADALILDLEDATPDREKASARRKAGSFIGTSTSHAGPSLFVRVNGLDTLQLVEDLTAVVREGLQGVVVPMVVAPEQILIVSYVLECLELAAGMPRGTVAIVPVLETAVGIKRAYDIALASPRVDYMGGISSDGGDVARELGFRWSRDGWETLTMRSQALVDARAAGVRNPMSGVWTDIADMHGLQKYAEQSRDLGYEGLLCIHPSHISIVNAVFSPSESDVRRARELIAALEAAEGDGRGAIAHEGKMIDAAMAETARRTLDKAAR